MHIGKKLFGLLFWVVLVYMIGILLFSRGFLLKRLVVEKNSTCDTDFTHFDPHGKGGCWMHPRFKRAIVLVIDALRYDFVSEMTVNENQPDLNYQNKLTTIHRLLRNRPDNSLLFKFIADPPTTTMQRIKGLTTGSLPTFVDAGANFASEAIKEDNFIDQFLSINKNIVFMGDDTWKGLYPSQFMRSSFYPSLNVKDLHTVDNGVIEHLAPEMKKKDWDVLIAHFLGVDHCGHTFGPYHSAMAEKLSQMNDIISEVVGKMDDDTLLVILGDHGMTKTGDHGGDSQDELEAALFMYSKQQLTKSQQENLRTVKQIDLVPTLSLLLGAPIPYSNLGMIIPELFNFCPTWKNDITPTKQVFHTVEALHLNAHQVHQYLQSYGEMSDDFPRNKYAELEWLFQKTEEQLQALVTALANGETKDTLTELKTLEANYKKYLESAREMCQDIWAKFDIGSMVLGIVAVIKAVFLSIYLYNMVECNAELTPQVMAGITTSIWAVLLFTFLSFLGLQLAGMIAALVTGICTIALFGLILYKILTTNKEKTKTSVSSKNPVKYLTYFAIFVMIAHNLSLLSNSFVVFEDITTSFLVQSLAWAMLFAMLRLISSTNKIMSSKKFDLGRVLTSPSFILVLMTLLFCGCIRLTTIFRACREEQTSTEWSCEVSMFLQPVAALAEQPSRNLRYFIALVSLVVLVGGSRIWLRYQGNMNGDAPAVLCARYTLPAMAVFTALHWALQGAPQKVLDRLPPWQLTVLPRLAYVAFAITLFTVWIKPLCVLLVKRTDNKDSMIPTYATDNLLPKVYSHFKEHWRTHLGGEKAEKKQPLAYGLASVFSASTIVLVVCMTLLCALLLGDGLSPPITLLVLAIFFLLELHAAYCRMLPFSNDSRYHVPFASVLMMSLLASYFFFATGHQATIANIHWHPAFVGFHGDHIFYAIPAFLVTMETFSSFVVCGLCLPLLIFWPRVRGRMAFMFEKEKAADDTEKRGEFVLNEDYVGLRTSLFKLLMAVLIIHGSKMLSAMLCAAIHRRHLMVWKIFAPRFVYEGATFSLICTLCVVVYALVARIDRAVDNWVKAVDVN